MSGCDLGSPLPFFPSFIRSNEQRGCLGPPITASSPCPSGALMHLCVYNSSLWPGSKLSQEPCILGHGHCLQGRQAIKTNTEQISNLLFKFGWKNVLFPLPRQPRAGQGGRAAPWGPRPERRSVRQSSAPGSRADGRTDDFWVKNHSFPEPALSHELPRWPGLLFIIITWNEKIPDWYQWRMIQNFPWLM